MLCDGIRLWFEVSPVAQFGDALDMRLPNVSALALVHFDAHCDTWQDHFGEPAGHGNWTYEAIAEGLVSSGTRPSSMSGVALRTSA